MAAYVLDRFDYLYVVAGEYDADSFNIFSNSLCASASAASSASISSSTSSNISSSSSSVITSGGRKRFKYSYYFFRSSCYYGVRILNTRFLTIFAVTGLKVVVVPFIKLILVLVSNAKLFVALTGAAPEYMS